MAYHLPVKSSSFNPRILDENKRKDEIAIAKSYSFASRTPADPNLKPSRFIEESTNGNANDSNKDPPDITLEQLTQDILLFVETLSSKQELTEIPVIVIQFLKKLETMIQQYESTSKEENPLVFGLNPDKDPVFVAAVTCLSDLIRVFDRFKSDDSMPLMNESSVILHHANVIFEYELRYLLEEEPSATAPPQDEQQSNKIEGTPKSAKKLDQQDQVKADNEKTKENDDKEESDKNVITFPPFSSDTISSIRMISNAMIESGYEVECCNVFIISRRVAFEEELKKLGFEKISVDDVQKMSWESLEGVITTWVRCFKHCLATLFPGEHNFYRFVLDGHDSAKHRLLSDLSVAVFGVLVNFAEAVSMTKRSTEKLFKFLDMYETLRDMIQMIENKDESIYPDDERIEDLKTELANAESRLGESAVSIFCQLENSIKNDQAKTPVPNGAVHPLTRYTLNYLKYACEYKQTLEEVFDKYLKNQLSHMYLPTKQEEEEQQQKTGGDEPKKSHKEPEKPSPFASQILTIMELLDANIDAKSKLYKDQSLRFIFLMNNGRYILQKVKGTPEIHYIVGDNWCRKRSSDVRQCHKGYQRETWGKVLQCLNQEGLQVNGKIHKPILKERFTNFNKQFDEVQKTQSAWVVSDEQLQTELRLSISSVMIPAYRSFLGRFGHIFTPK